MFSVHEHPRPFRRPNRITKLRRVPNPDRPISRQGLWQRKHRAIGLCVSCSRQVFRGCRCKRHYELYAVKQRLRYVPKRGRYGDVTERDLRAKLKRLTSRTRAKGRS
jgi:hypothetical protein